MKELKQHYTKENTFQGMIESNWESHIGYFLKSCAHWYNLDNEKVFFFRYLLAHSSNSCQYCDPVILQVKEVGSHATWKQHCDLFAARYGSVTN